MIEIAEADGLAVLTLNHGPVNALDLDLLREIPTALQTAADAPAVILTGTGSCFSAGIDLKQVVAGGAQYVEELLPALSSALLSVFDHPLPVVAAVNGHALAGGCVLAAACDIRIMSQGRIGLTELAAGVPFPTVALEVMRHAVGPALGAMLLAAPRLQAADALAIGLIHRTVQPEDLANEAIVQAGALRAAPCDLFAFSKRQLHWPASERILARRAADDERVLETWSAQGTRERLSEYLASLQRS